MKLFKLKNKLSSSSKDGAPPPSPSKRSSASSSRSSFSSTNSLRIRTCSLMSSLGTGSLGRDGSVSFIPSPKKSGGFSNMLFSSSATTADISDDAVYYDGIGIIQPTSTHSTMSSAPSRILGRCCSFLRVADLEMDDESIATTSVTSDISYINDNSQEHTHRPHVNPPPGIEVDPKERWIAICTTHDDESNNNKDLSNSSSSSSEHTPIAPLAIERLANFGTSTTLNESMWHPVSHSEKLIKKAAAASGSDLEWMKHTFQEGRVKAPTSSLPFSKDILVWSGSFIHGFYGSEVPAIRSAGIVETSAKKLCELLVDSNRVKEYNKISLGRTDIIRFDGSLDEEGPFGKSITKVMRSESKPPMMSPLVLTSILHSKKIPNGSGYLVVSRAVHRPEEESVASSMKTEIVMGVNLLVDFDDNCEDGSSSGNQRCLMINVNHMRSPMVPLYIAKRVAVTTAHKFINDIRSLV